MDNPSQRTGGKPRTEAHRPAPPGEDPGTLTDEEYLSDGGPDALDAAAPPPDKQRHDDRTDDGVGAEREAHADSPPQTATDAD